MKLYFATEALRNLNSSSEIKTFGSLEKHEKIKWKENDLYVQTSTNIGNKILKYEGVSKSFRTES
jgi:hypothetical protein